MTIKLELMTTDPEEVQLAVRYWAMSDTGEFVEKVMDLVPFRHITHSGTLASHVRQLCRAFDENLTCRYCDGYIEVKSRSTAKKYPQKALRPCPACQELHAQQERAEQAAAAAELEKQLCAYIQQLPSGPIDYTRLSDDQALVLLALDIAISPRLISEAFTVSDCQALVPLDAGLFIERLEAAGILREDPRRAMPGTYFLRDSALLIRTRQIAYALAPDEQFGSGDEAMQTLLTRQYSDTTALFNLWLDLATADAMRYLLDKCRSFDHDLDESQLKEVRSTLHSALKTYSVSQIWFVIWKSVKDAASLARLVYYSATRATATIPGKIRRTLEKIEKEGTTVRKWDRPDHHPSGTLGMLFTELFGIDEDTPGVSVLARLTQLMPGESGDDIDLPHAEPVRQLLCEALVNDTGPQMLHQFATLIREGHEIGRAIAAMLGRSATSQG
jgi:hypothetical protein